MLSTVCYQQLCGNGTLSNGLLSQRQATRSKLVKHATINCLDGLSFYTPRMRQAHFRVRIEREHSVYLETEAIGMVDLKNQ